MDLPIFLKVHLKTFLNSEFSLFQTDFPSTAFHGGLDGKNWPAMQETWVRSLGWEDPLEKGTGYLLQYSCLENPHGQRSLAGYSPKDCKESDTTATFTFHPPDLN